MDENDDDLHLLDEKALIAKLPDQLKMLVKANRKELNEPLACVNDCGSSLAEMLDHEVAAGHYATALYLLAPMISMERAREVLSGKPADYAPYYQSVKAIGAALLARRNQRKEALGEQDLGRIIMEALQAKLGAAGMDVRVTEIPLGDAGKMVRVSGRKSKKENLN